MLKERAKIVAIEDNAVWVETVQLSTCGSCAAKKGCGQALLASLGAKPNYVRVLLDGNDHARYRLNQFISIGLPENIVVKASLFLYLLPLLLMMLCGGVTHYFASSELLTIFMAVLGLLVGGFFIKLFSDKYQNDQRFQPMIIEEEPVSLLNETDIVYKPLG